MLALAFAAVLATPSPSPSPTVTALDVVIGSVRCPAGAVPLAVTNTTPSPVFYSVQVDRRPAYQETIQPRMTRRNSVTLRRGATSTIQVIVAGRPVATGRRTASCASPSPAPTPAPTTAQPVVPPPRRLPRTGAGAGLLAKGATGAGALITGGIVCWYALVWPRKRIPDGPLAKRPTED